MGTQTVSIQITAKDGASAVFTKIGASAKSAFAGLATSGKQAASGLKEVGSAGSAAGSGLGKLDASSSKAAGNLNKVGTAANKAGTDFDKLGSRATAAGAAMGTAVAGFAKLGAAAVQQQQSIKGIERAYGDAADGVIEFTNALQDSTAFSNEQARDAAQIASTLVKNYGMSVEATEDLIARSADLATVYGIDLADAVQRTSSAIRGEAESAELLGLSLQDNYVQAQAAARGITGWSTTMTEAEKAAFRMTLVMEQSNYAVGAAGEFAETSAGRSQQFANTIQDMTVNLGSMLGPLGGATAGMADMSIALTLGGAAIGKFVGGLAGMGTKLANVVTMINPVGLAITALVLAGGAVVAAWQINEQANAALADSYTDLNAAIESTMTAQQALAASQVRFDFGQSDQVSILAEKYGLAENAAQDFFNYLGGVQSQFEVMNLTTQEQTKLNELLAQSFTNVADSGTDSLIQAMSKLETEVESFATSGTLAMSTLEDLNTALEFNGDGADKVDAAVKSLTDSYSAGVIDAQTFADGLDYVANNLQEIAAEAPAAESRIDAVNRRLSEIGTALEKAQSKEDLIEGMFGSAARWEAQADAIQGVNDAMLEVALASGAGFGLGFGEEERAAVAAYGEELAAAAEKAQETAAAFREQLVPSLEGASSGFAAMAQPGEDVLDTLSRIAPNVNNAGGAFLQFADNLNDAQQALSGVLGMFDAIDSLGQGAGAAESIATELIGAPGEWATIDDLVTNAAITQGEYNNAVQAGMSIQESNVAIQEDLNAIRAQQLPLLDSQVAKLEAYVDGLSNASSAEQQQALYLMDSANQAKVAAAYSTAYAASLGEIPEDVATTIIADGAQADPVLGDILERFGLIEVGANGEITVDFPNKATLDDVVSSVDRLTEISAIELLINMSGGEVAEGQVTRVQEIVDELDGKTATTTVKVELDDETANAALAGRGLEGTSAGTITVPVEADTAPLKAGIESVDPAPVVVPVEFSTQAAKSPLTGIEAEGKTVTVEIEAQDNASPTIARVMQAASALQSVSGSIELKATDNASSTIARVMQAADALQSVSGSITLEAEDATGAVIARAMQAANAFADGSYQALIEANDQSSALIGTIQGVAETYASGTYNAAITATDSASAVIDSAEGNAVTYAAGDYTAVINANDQASALFNTVTGLAQAYAVDYSATLSAVDNASGTINSVAAALASLDGTVATTYVDVVQRGTLPAQALGGQVRGDMPTARLGRNVLVGEAGPEVVTMPFGAFVKPHGAGGKDDPSKQQAPDLTPEVDLEKAYKRGGDSAEAFYKGLLDEAKTAMRDLKSEIGDTRYDSKDDARAAIREYMQMERQADTIFDKIERGARYDANMRERLRAEARAAAQETARDTKATGDKVVDTMSAAGTEAGTEFSEELSGSMDLGSVMDQVGALKDEFIATMKTSAGSTEDVTGAVASFNEEIANITGSLKAVDKSGSKSLEGVSDSFGQVEEDAQDMGDTVGEELDEGVSAGAESAEDALARLSQTLGAVSSQSIDPSVGLDDQKAASGIRDISGDLSTLNSTSATPDVDVKVDDSEWEAFKREIAAAQLGATVTVKVKEKPVKKQLGGAITPSIDRDVPHAANGRVITVGEAGEENVYLPYGAMVMPHDASRSRDRADGQYSGNIQFFGPVTIVPPTPDLHAAVVSQFMSMDRD